MSQTQTTKSQKNETQMGGEAERFATTLLS
jgi:hypothetical protein